MSTLDHLKWEIHRYRTDLGVLGGVTRRTLDTGRYLLKVISGGRREWVWSVHDKTQSNVVGKPQRITGGTVTTLIDAKAAALQWVKEHP